MKKFTFMMIAAFLAVASFAGVPVRKSEMATPRMMTAVRTTVPTQKAMTSTSFSLTSAKKVKAAKKAPRKISSTEELAGEYMLISSYYEWDDEQNGFVDAAPDAGAIPVTISVVDETTISIEGFTSDATEAILATVNVEDGTISIEAGQKLLDSTYGTVVLEVEADEENAPLTGTIGEGFISLNELWTTILADGDYAGYMWSNFYYYSDIMPSNGTMTWGEKSKPVVVLQSEDLKTVTVFNFGGYETAIDISIKEDNKFVIESQLVEDGGETYGKFYTYGLSDDESSFVALTGTGTETTLTFDCKWTLYSTTGYWYGAQVPATITLAEGETIEYPVYEDVAAMPANPEIIEVGEYNEAQGYGYVTVYVPTTDVDGNDLMESKLYYQLFSDVKGDIQPIVYSAELYKNLEEDLSVIPYSLYDSYDFDVEDGYKLIYLNFDYTNYNRVGVKSIYLGGDETNETEIQWFKIEKATEADFDFNAMDIATSNSTSTDGDILQDTTLVAGLVSLTISPKTESATTQNRFWSTNKGPQLRAYSGTLTFEAEEGYTITSIVFNTAKWNEGNTADSGELGTNEESAYEWTGDAQTVVLTIAGNTQFNSIVVNVKEHEELVVLPEGIEAQAWAIEGVHTEGRIQQAAAVAFDGADVYIQGLAYFIPEAWVKGTLDEEGIITIPSGLYVGENEKGKEYILGYSDAIGDIELVYDAEAQTIKLVDGFIIENPNKESLSFYGYWSELTLYAGEPVILEPVVAPENLETETYLFSSQVYEYDEDDEEIAFEDYAFQVQVGFDGDDLYIQGISGDLPEAWVKATKNEEGKYIIPANQFMGTLNILDMYFYDYFFTAVDEEEGNLIDVVLTVDPETGTITTDQLLALNEDKKALNYFLLFKDVVLTKLVEFAATPADPSVEAFDATGKYPHVDFNIPSESTEGETLIEGLLSYQIFIEKDGVEQPLMLTTDLYDSLEEDMTVVPYTFTDDYDIYYGGGRVYLNQDLEEIKTWTKIGVQSTYTAAGETHQSNLVWYDLGEYWYAVGINNVAAGNQLVQYFDLQGRAAKASQKGLLIKQVRQQDGSVKTTKVIRK